MPNPSVPQAKNLMRRAVRKILEGGLSASAEDAVWDYFQSECAYCGKKIDRSRREGHLDHAEPAGGNHLGNRILACAPCNGNEKREERWQDFLARKSPNDAVRRAERILGWMTSHPPQERLTTPEIEGALAKAEQAIGAFQAACDELRAAVQAARAPPERTTPVEPWSPRGPRK